MTKTAKKRGSNSRGNSQGRSSNGRPRHRSRKVNSSLTPTVKAEFEGDDNGDPLPLQPGYGLLELHPNGYGFLRNPENNYSREISDPFVPGTMIERYQLRQGLMISGMVQQGRGQQGPRLREITQVEGISPEEYAAVKPFEELTAINPEQWLRLETSAEPLTTRVIDLLTPLGRGQRALIVAPPRTGKTVLLQHISQGIAQNYPDLHLIMLLIDERPEEVTDMRRSVKGEVVVSSLDQDVESHVRLLFSSQFIAGCMLTVYFMRALSRLHNSIAKQKPLRHRKTKTRIGLFQQARPSRDTPLFQRNGSCAKKRWIGLGETISA